MKKTAVLDALLAAAIFGNALMFAQDESPEATIRQEAAAAAAAAARVSEAKDIANDKARKSFIDGLQRQSLSSLLAMRVGIASIWPKKTN